MCCQNAQEWLYKILCVCLYLEILGEGLREIGDIWMIPKFWWWMVTVEGNRLVVI